MIIVKKKRFLFVFALLFSGGLLWMSCSRKEKEIPPAPWPEWAFHHWVWEDESTQDSAIALVDGYLEREIPVGAIIIDSPWESGYNTFEFDPSLYPDAKAMIDYFHSKGIRVFIWITSAINTDVPELFNYAKQRGYFMQKSAVDSDCVIEWWKGEGCLIDYFNPEAVQWWHTLVDKTLALGIDGWKVDGTDYLVLFGMVPYSPGLSRNVERIEYSHAYYRDFFEYTREKLGEDRIITARPIDNYGSGMGGDFVAFAPVDINWAGWVGDQDATFDGLKKALNNMLWSSDYGYVAFGSDIGGYRENKDYPEGRSKELFIRWAQLGAFSPVMENGGGGEHRPWAFDEETTEIYRRFVQLHYAIIPYLMEKGAEAWQEGVSLMNFIYGREDHYLLGPDILVAPMLEPTTERTVSFPAGSDWVYLFEKTRIYTGGTEARLTIPLSEFPVFLKQDSEIARTLTVN